jgi:hypothetical protein
MRDKTSPASWRPGSCRTGAIRSPSTSAADEESFQPIVARIINSHPTGNRLLQIRHRESGVILHWTFIGFIRHRNPGISANTVHSSSRSKVTVISSALRLLDMPRDRIAIPFSCPGYLGTAHAPVAPQRNRLHHPAQPGSIAIDSIDLVEVVPDAAGPTRFVSAGQEPR